MIRVADYIFNTLADAGVKHVFLVTGGGAMFLNDALAGEERIQFVCNHHEQACAMAAEGYARISGKPGVLCVTTGPGGINALNGVFGAWTDSIPMLVISGQVKRETCMSSYPDLHLRQLGDQEADIISMVKGITKYAVQVNDPETIRYHLERAWHLAQTGRPGPCWLDIPIDVQSAKIDPASLTAYDPREDEIEFDPELLAAQCRQVIERIKSAERPVIMAGTGVRLSGAVEIFRRVAHKLGIPVVTAWTHDLLPGDDPVFCGRPGTIGERAGNFAVQNADLLLIIGSRLNIRQTSYNWSAFAPSAYKIQVDIDAEEMRKPTLDIAMPIQSDARLFLEELHRQLVGVEYDAEKFTGWLKWCRERGRLYPVVQERQRTAEPPINPYHFTEELFKQLTGDDIIVCGNGSATILPFQAGKIKDGMRLFSNSGSASMGYDLPAAIGAAFARPGQRVICLAGDGSLMMNLQELQVLAHYQLPVKVFVLSNGGYLSIRSTQGNFFGRFIGESKASGVSFPSYTAIGAAFGIPAQILEHPLSMALEIQLILDSPGPSICEVFLDQNQQFEPRIRSKTMPDGKIVSPSLEDMYPFLDEEELRENMIAFSQSVKS